MSEAGQWDEALAQTTGYEHARLLSALEERIHTWAARMSELEEDSEDERLWTWRSTDLGDYIEWTVRCDGALFKGGPISRGQDGLWRIDTYYDRTDIECPRTIGARISMALYAAFCRGPSNCVGIFSFEDFINEVEPAEHNPGVRHISLEDLSDAEFEAR